MTQPTGPQIQAAIQEMRDEAALWDDMTQQALHMSATAANLTLNVFHFSGLGHLVGVDDRYTELQQRITGLLVEAMRNFSSTSEALYEAAHGYESDEENAVHRMRNIY
jgi:hypothetical protein